MVEFEGMNGSRVLVNPDHVKCVEAVPGMIGCFSLVMEYFATMTTTGPAMMQHAVQVKGETFDSVAKKLGAKAEPERFFAGLAQAN